MNLAGLLKRVLPFFAGIVIGLIPTWIFTSPTSVEVVLTQPALVKSQSSCYDRSKFQKEDETKKVDSKLRILSKPRPSYTEAARTENVEGSVVLSVTFLESGNIGDVKAIKGLPNGLTEHAIAAAKEIEFEPAMDNGRPVSVTKQVEYTFSIY